MRLQVSHEVSIEEWQEVSRQCSYATFFHTPLWLGVFPKSFPRTRIATKKFQFENGSVAIFPLLERKVRFGLATLYESTAEGCYGGWISSDPLPSECIRAMCQWLFRNCRNIAWRTNPLDGERDELAGFTTHPDTTEILFLKDFETEESLLRHYKHSVRKQINKAKRADLEARLAVDWRDWKAYFQVYQSSVQRWGKKAYIRYPMGLFRNLFDLKSPQAKLWLVTSQDRVVGGNLNFYHNEHAVEWHAAFDAEFFALGARNFLVHTIISDAMRDGYAYYDFNPSGPLEGARRFKQTFGTRSVPASIITRRHGLQRLPTPRGIVRIVRKLSGQS